MRQSVFSARKLLTAAGASLVLGSAAPALAQDAAPPADDQPSDIQFAPDDDEPKAAAPQQGQVQGQPQGQAQPSGDGTTRKIEGEKGAEDRKPDPASQAGSTSPLGESGSLQIHGRHEGEPTLFGTYRVRVSYNWPKFDNGLKYYDKLYGKENQYPELAADWFAWDWYATLGLGFRIGYYTADGHAAACAGGSGGAAGSCQNPSGLPADQLSIDQAQKTALTILPLQVVATAEFTPFDRKWVVIDGWIGLERAYWQETRQAPQTQTPTTTPTTTTPTTTPTTTTTATAPADTTLTNTGWTSATTVGVSANILLNGLDPTSAASMRGPMGLGYIYLSPSIEIVRSLNKKGVSWGRTVYALGFTFESVH